MGIFLAFVGAVLLAAGTEMQHVGVKEIVQPGRGLSVRKGLRLLSTRTWLAGGLIIGVAIAIQLWSLHLAPLAVVQPVGAIGIVVAAILQARRTNRRLTPRRRLGVAFCVAGIAGVVIAAVSGASPEIVTPISLLQVLVIGSVVAAIAGLAQQVTTAPSLSALAGAIMFGFVACLGQIVIDDLAEGRFDSQTLISLIGVAALGAVGSLWVQRAHARGSSTLVLAALTVVDPLSGIVVTSVFFRSLMHATPLTIGSLVAAGLVATVGVILLAHSRDQ